VSTTPKLFPMLPKIKAAYGLRCTYDVVRFTFTRKMQNYCEMIS